MSQKNPAEYTGVDNLEVMLLAKNYNDWLIHRIESVLAGTGPLLDFGAGIGYFAKRLRSNGLSVTCIEADPILCEKLNQQGLPSFPSIEMGHQRLYKNIYTLNVLEHIEDDQRILSDLFYCLEPAGRLYIYVPAFQFLFSSMDKKVGHFRRYEMRSLLTLLQNQGFEIQSSSYRDFVGFWATILYKWFGRSDGNLNKNSLLFFDRILFPLNNFFDFVFGRFVGKNLEVVARKPIESKGRI